MKFTKQSIEKIALPKKGKRLIVWDAELKGFGMRITPSGKMYIAQARVKGKSRRVSIGKHGILTLQEARKKAQKELSRMIEGKDPVVEKKTQEAYSRTLRELTEKYIQDHKDLKSSSKADIEKHLKGSFAKWADKPASAITRDAVMRRFQELTGRSPAQANQAFRILRAIFNYARAAYRDERVYIENPVHVLSEAKIWNRVKARSGRIPTDKIGKAWNMLQGLRDAPEQTTISRSLADVVSFLLLTGARWNEAAQLTWDHVNLEEAWWYLPDPKNRNPVKFPLSDIAKSILEERPRDGQYVFPARSKDGYVSDPRGIMSKISEIAGVHLSAHDLRRTFRAIAGECQIELWKCKLLMNHKMSQDVTINAYTETNDLRYLVPEINLVAEWITQQKAVAVSDKVLPFKAMNERGKT